MKRSFCILFCVLLISFVVVIPVGAANNSYQYGLTSEIIHPYTPFSTVYMDWVEDGNQGIRQYISFDVDTSVTKWTTVMDENLFSYSPSFTYILSPWIQSSSDPVPDVINQTVNYSYSDDVLTLSIPFCDQLNHLAENERANIRFQLIESDEYIYINRFVGFSEFFPDGSINANTNMINGSDATCSLTITYAEALSEGSLTTYRTQTKTFVGNTWNDVSLQIINTLFDNTNSAAQVLPTIAISNMYMAYSIQRAPYGTGADQSLNGEIEVELYFTSYDYRSVSDFLSQGRWGRIETETIVNNTLDISGVFGAVKNALAVDIVGPLSFLDMLTIVVALSISVWILKLFAGG